MRGDRNDEWCVFVGEGWHLPGMPQLCVWGCVYRKIRWYGCVRRWYLPGMSHNDGGYSRSNIVRELVSSKMRYSG